MLYEEYPYNDNPNLIRHYSDTYTIIQVETGNEYGEAIDKYPCEYTYVESDNPLDEEDEYGTN